MSGTKKAIRALSRAVFSLRYSILLNDIIRTRISGRRQSATINSASRHNRQSRVAPPQVLIDAECVHCCKRQLSLSAGNLAAYVHTKVGQWSATSAATTTNKRVQHTANTFPGIDDKSVIKVQPDSPLSPQEDVEGLSGGSAKLSRPPSRHRARPERRHRA